MKSLILASLLFLSGCTLWTAFNTAPYDSNEYNLVTKVRVLANGGCDKDNLKSIYITSQQLKFFSQYLPYNDRTISMTNNLFNITEGLYKKENPSEIYCKSKLEIGRAHV